MFDILLKIGLDIWLNLHVGIFTGNTLIKAE